MSENSPLNWADEQDRQSLAKHPKLSGNHRPPQSSPLLDMAALLVDFTDGSARVYIRLHGDQTSSTMMQISVQPELTKPGSVQSHIDEVTYTGFPASQATTSTQEESSTLNVVVAMRQAQAAGASVTDLVGLALETSSKDLPVSDIAIVLIDKPASIQPSDLSPDRTLEIESANLPPFCFFQREDAVAVFTPDGRWVDFDPAREEPIQRLCIPLKYRQVLLGCYVVLLDEPSVMSSFQVDTSTAIAKQMSLAIGTKRIVDDLAVRQDFTRFTLSAEKAGTWSWDIPNDVVVWSAETGLLHGLSTGYGTGTLERLVKLVYPEDREAVRAAVNQALASLDSYEIEYRIQLADGSIRWTGALGQVVADDRGQPSCLAGVCMDITDRKLAEEAHRSSDLLYQTLAETVPHMVWVSEPDGTMRYCNHRWHEYAELTVEDMAQGKIDDSVHPDDLDQVRAKWQETLGSGQSFSAEYRFRRAADGIYRWHIAQAVPLKGTDGSIECWLGTLTDVDSQKRQADAHRYLIRAGMVIAESPDYESTLSAVAHLAIPEFADWCIVHLLESDGMIRVVEIAHANPVNSQWADELLQKYQVDPIALVGVSNVIRTGKSVVYTRITDDLLTQSAKDDEHHSLLRQAGLDSAMIVPLNCGCTALGAITYITAGSGKHYDETDLAHAEDLAYRAALAVTNAQLQQTTQRHLAERTTTEAALRESESRFRAMADSAPVMLWMTNATGKCNYFSKAWLAFTGRQLAEEVGDGWAQGLDPDDLDRCSRMYRQAFDQRIPYEIEYRLRRFDGEIRWIWDNATPVWTAEGEFVGYIGSCIDITERKMAADENARLLQELRGSSQRERAILRDVLASLTQHRLSLCDNPDGLPSRLPIIVASLDLDASSLRDLRGMIEDTAIEVGLPEERWTDLVNAAGEAALNAVMHAGGGQAHIFTDGQAIVQVWVEDDGTGISAIPGALEPGFTTAGSFGHGFWMMLEMADRMWLLTGDTGTTVVIEQHSKRPEPTWMHNDFSTATM